MSIIYLIWRGKGWVVAAATFICSLIAEILTRVITQDDTYYGKSPYPLAIAFFAASLTTIYLTYKLKNEPKQNHSLFFIPIWYWRWILLAIGVLVLVIRMRSSS